MTRTSGSEINYLEIFVHPSSARCTKQIQTMCLCVIGQKRLNEDRTKTSAHVIDFTVLNVLPDGSTFPNRAALRRPAPIVRLFCIK